MNGKETVHTVISVLRMAAGALFLLWMVMGALPTGWIFDLGVGAGTGQGQKNSGQVRRLATGEQLEQYYFEHTPATARGERFVLCPVMRLRDPGEEGVHNTRGRYGRRTRKVSEYYDMGYPVSGLQRVLSLFVAASSYNSYYLLELEDGTYLCVFFDDYLLLQRPFQAEIALPTGYVRPAALEEKQMLREMAADYPVNEDYVLDMYRYGKAPWMLDKGLRLILAGVIVVLYLSVREKIQKKRQKVEVRRYG